MPDSIDRIDAIDDLDVDRIKRKEAWGVYLASIEQPSEITHYTPKLDISQTTLKKSSKKPDSSLPNRPALVHPDNLQSSKRPTVEHSIITMNNRINKTHDKFVRQESEEMQQIDRSLDELHKKYLEELKEHAINAQNKSAWGTLINVTAYIASITSIMSGVVLLSSGPVGIAVGKLLIVSGALGLFNRIISDTGGFENIVAYFTKNEETQQKVAYWLNISMICLTLGLGLYSVFAGIHGGVFALANLPGAGQTLLKSMTITSVVLQALGNLMHYYYSRKINNQAALITKNQSESTYLENNLSEKVQLIDKSFQTTNSSLKVAQNALNGMDN